MLKNCKKAQFSHKDIPFIDKIPEKAELKKSDILYVHRANLNRKMEYAKEGTIIINK